MPRFYFHIRDGRDLLDADGIDLVNEAAAQVEAVRLAGEVLKDEAAHVIQTSAWSLDVADEMGRVVCELGLRITGKSRLTAGSASSESDLQRAS